MTYYIYSTTQPDAARRSTTQHEATSQHDNEAMQCDAMRCNAMQCDAMRHFRTGKQHRHGTYIDQLTPDFVQFLYDRLYSIHSLHNLHSLHRYHMIIGRCNHDIHPSIPVNFPTFLSFSYASTVLSLILCYLPSLFWALSRTPAQHRRRHS